ncbi:ribosome biogenesis/translation initiation ATPase RLI [Candidatus Woesearchaeota archaeon]|nr:ribosome biogenesis/translation initiation ATPase RLI [Candidatus Woesearchaeota archaeon]
MKRLAIVDKTKCKNKVDCPFICGGVCPVNRSGNECIIESSDKKVEINEELCIGCGICPKKCPFEAIKIINLPEELEKEPIHRYSKNGFALYNLPIPVFGKVVGIIGINGIGKTTAIKILAGVLKPNLGKMNEEAKIDEIIEYFKGTEAQLFFQKIKNNEIKISYKPQHVDMIPKQYKGKVIDLLKKVDEKNQLNQTAERLEITKILETSIDNISGGELQRVAIAAAVLKKANLYIFDELTSYLDIKQRLKISKFIRELADENTAVIVIEHDLIALDYMADLINIMYGKAGCYGVVSSLKAAKNGINTFLNGYLKEENIRFRDHKIKFEVKPPVKTKEQTSLISWPEFNKKLGNFRLTANEGEVYINEKVGVLGENGIGKTTFVKLLAGVINPDDKEIKLKVKVSYKPQYIENESDELVVNILRNAITKYEIELIRALNLKPLFTKRINELSGGELQKVAICEALAKESDLILLDEPSAYLDVEQRLIISKVIANIVEKRNISCLVVDHDLLFLDYLSDRLLVFKGEPAAYGISEGPFSMEKGMNNLLRELSITLRRDEESKRPRINKLDSVKDREQKSSGKYYYS